MLIIMIFEELNVDRYAPTSYAKHIVRSGCLTQTTIIFNLLIMIFQIN